MSAGSGPAATVPAADASVAAGPLMQLEPSGSRWVKVIDQTRCIRELFERRVRQGEDLRVRDVRQPAEWRDDGAIPDSLQMFVADVPARVAELPRDAELWVGCTTGHRATIAASLLDRVDVPVRLVARGGTVGWIERFEEPATAGLGTA